MIEAILFDLDGTLLPINTDQFVDNYLKLISSKMTKYMQPEQFIKELVAATDVMVKDVDLNISNEQSFFNAFSQSTGLARDEILPDFDAFYNEHFWILGNDIIPKPIVKDIISLARKKFKLVVATNPVFPLVALVERMRWAGIDQSDFVLITSYELMHACKPNMEYFLEITRQIDVEPEKCLMVGNDIDEDMVAKKIGMKTFLVDEFLINRNGLLVESDYRGSLEDLYDLITKLESKS
ncbi:HAD family hydrolase [Bacillota bacterium LX-D]|nr:HAD family hydrolase [Bacillota bacterium LX-D]